MDYFRAAKSVALPVYGGLCHASHLHSDGNVQKVVRTESLATMATRMNLSELQPVPIFSTSTGRPFSASMATELLEQVVDEILTQPIQWERVREGVVRSARDSGVMQIELVVFRVSLAAQELATSITNKLSPEVSSRTTEMVPWIYEQAKTPGARGPSQSKIAIVGMACRMPGGADTTDKFWDVLDGALDVTRKIPADRFDVDTHFVSTLSALAFNTHPHCLCHPPKNPVI